MDKELHALLEAARQFFASAATAHCEDRPEDSNAYSVLALSGSAFPEIRISLAGPTLINGHVVQCGYVYRGEFMPFGSWRAAQPKPSEVN